MVVVVSEVQTEELEVVVGVMVHGRSLPVIPKMQMEI